MPRNMPSLPVILLLEHVDRQNLIVCSSVLVHRSLLEAEAAHSLQSFGFGDMQYGQDYDLWRRCLALSSRDVDGFRVGASIVKEALVVYDTKGSDRSSVRKEARQTIEVVRKRLIGIAFPGAQSSRGAGHESGREGKRGGGSIAPSHSQGLGTVQGQPGVAGPVGATAKCEKGPDTRDADRHDASAAPWPMAMAAAKNGPSSSPSQQKSPYCWE
uniref:Uncharacterized protein n=1 Tax=Rhizochromulina marina TaxID=1034831 RepID=A0A6U0YQA5_9STRA|mmetsp:Transcript_18586/g.54158  ORF Transcript_18586/g.54158 Transcript_18586/m.54158 type:complete len:214 (+) Transcript_18586:694-1335(+)